MNKILILAISIIFFESIILMPFSINNSLLLIPIFLMTLIVFLGLTNETVLAGTFIGILTALLEGLAIQAYTVPFLIVVVIYYWVGRFIDNKSFTLRQLTLSQLISSMIWVFVLTVFYSLIFLVIRHLNIIVAVENFKAFLYPGIIAVNALGVVLASAWFRYVSISSQRNIFS